jgi:hypothetical protein
MTITDDGGGNRRRIGQTAAEEHSMTRPDWVPEGIDTGKPSTARIYDYWLGGTHNFAIDREIARKVSEAIPDTAMMMQANRAFLRRAVGFLIDQGVRQFLDLGSGIPTLGNVHEVAQKAAPEARVVYVDVDPVAAAHSRHILAGNENAAVLREDLRNVESVLESEEVDRLLDLEQPVAVLMLAVLHFVPDEDDPAGIVARFRDRLAVGSYLALSHGSQELMRRDAAQVGRDQFTRTATPFVDRDRAAITAFFDGFDVVDPGVVWSVQWRPEHPDEVGDQPERSSTYVGVGRKS